MTDFRVSRPAQTDLETILAVSLDRWGEDGQTRYMELLAGAFRMIAGKPTGPMTRDRSDLFAGIRSFHVRHLRRSHGVQDPAHIVYYRVTKERVIEIVRVLHERMDPVAQLAQPLRTQRKRRT